MAIKIYYENTELSNAKIRELFNEIKPSTLTKIKNAAVKEMAIRGTKTFGSSTVNTKVAFEVWGLEITDLEHRLTKLKKFGFITFG